MATTTRFARIALLGPALAVVLSSSAEAAAKKALCTATQLNGAGTKAAAALKCYANIPPGPAQDACLVTASTKFFAVFAKAEKMGGCVTTADASTIETTVDLFVADIVSLLNPALVPTPTPGGCGFNPGCGGSCPTPGDTCGIVECANHTCIACVCLPPTPTPTAGSGGACGPNAAGQCSGSCPAPQSCQFIPGIAAVCGCVTPTPTSRSLPPTPTPTPGMGCALTSPQTCGGTCPAGTVCDFLGSTVPNPCACVTPTPTPPAGPTCGGPPNAAGQCSGSCPAGQTCQIIPGIAPICGCM